VTTKHKPTSTRINTSFILNDYVRKEDGKQQLKASTRIYHHGLLKARFSFLIDLNDEPIMLHKKDIKKGVVNLDHPLALLFNGFIRAVKNEIDRIAPDHIKNGVNIESFKADLKRFCKHYEPYVVVERIVMPQADLKQFYVQKMNDNVIIDKAVFNKVANQDNLDADTGEPIPFEELEDVIVHEQVEYERKVEQFNDRRTTEQKFKDGDFPNRNNIFEIFAATYYDKEITNDFYSKIVIRLFEYRERKKPLEDVQFLDTAWAKKFFQWQNDEGWYNINTKTFDPLNYDRSIFFQDKPHQRYADQTFNKNIRMFREIVKQLYRRGYLKNKIDLEDLKLADFRKKTVLSGTRLEHHLFKAEFDELFSYKFNNKKLKEYQAIYDDLWNKQIITGKKARTVTIEKLNLYRDVFCFMTMVGGQRGIEEFNSTELLYYTKTENVIKFYQNKGKNVVVNPFNPYTAELLKRWKNQLPQLSTAEEYEEYRAFLKVIGFVVGLKRQVQEVIDSNKFVPLMEILNPYMCRKTFGTVMYEQFDYDEKTIGIFTGHKERNAGELNTSYINKKNIENKKRKWEGLKPE
jgi:integrase